MDPVAGIAGTFGLERLGSRGSRSSGRLTLIGERAGPTYGSGEVECVIDGFVVNASEIARRRPGHDIATAVAAGYLREGEAFVARLRGDFVVLLWNRRTLTGVIARDPLGGRSLFLWREGRGVAFASEIRTLLAMLPRTPEPDRRMVLRWLGFEPGTGPATPYAGVEALLPGELVRLGSQGAEVARFWTPRYQEPAARTFADAAEEVRASTDRALERSVEGLESVGVLMSGGLDSSTLAVLADRKPLAVRGYSAVFPDMPTVDESGFIDSIAERTDLPVTRMAVRGGSMVRSALRFSRDWRLPLVSQNLDFWLPLMYRARADGAGAMLDGEGGDLLFAARPELIGDRLMRARALSALRLARELPGGRSAPWRSVVSLTVRQGGGAALAPGLTSLTGRADLPAWIRTEDRMLASDTDRDGWKRLDGPRWWAKLAHQLTEGLHATGIRDHQRRRAILGGLETRSPFFDTDLVELMLSLPPELAFGPRSRPLQREIAVGALPDDVRLRPGKSYFDELFYRSLAIEDLPVVMRLLRAPDAELRAWVDLDAVRAELLDPGPYDCAGGVRTWLRAVWRLTAVESWLRELASPGFGDRLIDEMRLEAPRIEWVGPAAKASA